MSHRVLVVGGGTIGRAVWQGLHGNLDFDVKVLDADPNHPWKDFDWFIHEPDFFKGQTPYRYLGFYDYLVMAAPVYDPQAVIPIIYDCAQTDTHYIDFSEDVVVRDEIKSQFGDTKLNAIIPGCGLAPGMVQVLAQRLTEPFDEVLDIDMSVGSLPVFVSNTLGYVPMWSVDGVINEYTNPVHSLEHGIRHVRNPLDWEFSAPLLIDGVQYERFSTSGGLGTMIDTWAGRAKNVRYRTIRYPGHQREIKSILNVRSDEPRRLRTKDDYKIDRLRDVLNELRTVNPVEDRVIIHIEVRGLIDGELRTNVFSRDIRRKKELVGYISAISRSTAAGAVAAIEAQAAHGFTGLVRQEDIAREICEQAGTLTWGGYLDGS